MLTTKSLVLRTLKWLLILYILICVILYFFQEKIIFFPDKLAKDHRFTFDQSFQEINIKADGKLLHGLLFEAEQTLKLQEEFKKGDTLITLKGQGHNGMTDNGEYVEAIEKLLK